MILGRLRLLHALSLSAPATACHAPSTERRLSSFDQFTTS